jgi:hypothetical protein
MGYHAQRIRRLRATPSPWDVKQGSDETERDPAEHPLLAFAVDHDGRHKDVTEVVQH